MQKANRFLGIISIGIGLAIILSGYFSGLTLIEDKVPGPGFLPFWTALGIISCGIVILVSALNPKAQNAEAEKSVFKKHEFNNFIIVIGISIAVIILSPYLGMIITLGLAVAAMAKLFGCESWKSVIGLAIGSGLTFYLIFVKFLAVPLPVGVFGF